ncbi:MAG: hypothetical protein ACREJX_01300 [Polyangiaceae bacterium]
MNDALAHVAILSSCGSNANDIAIDGTGQMYMNVANDAIYKLALDGTCSARNVLDAIAGDHLKIAARAAGTPSIITVDPQHPNLYSLDPNSMGHAHITSINNNELVDNPPYDIACDNAGTCWAFLSHTNCSAGSTNACLYSFPADGSSDAVFVASIAVLPEGLAYANGSLWAFDDIGDIYEVTLAAPVMVTEKNPTHSGFAPPTTYTGAGSSSSY